MVMDAQRRAAGSITVRVEDAAVRRPHLFPAACSRSESANLGRLMAAIASVDEALKITHRWSTRARDAPRSERVLTAASPMGNADEPIFFKCAHIEFVGGDSFDRTAIGAKPLSFLFSRWGAANGGA